MTQQVAHGVGRVGWRTYCLLLGLLVLGAQTRAEQAGIAAVGPETTSPLVIIEEDSAPDAPDTPDAADAVASASAGADSRLAISGEITRMKADIATLARFARWQETLLRIARTDPAEALRQRLPMSECRASVLAPLCEDLTAMFRPEGDGSDDPYAAPDTLAPGSTE